MNDEQATLIRIYQYLLSKEVHLKNQIYKTWNRATRKNPSADDILEFWIAKIKLEIWNEFSREVWNLLR